ncbi:MAG: flagellar basal-body rod protein FlgG, partial [Polaromonas sp.]|nr:flagellar basal-body rod protein FlgG [Polaromonas sp.]
TTGFKRSRAVFEDLMYQNLRQSGGQTSDQTRLPSGLQLGTGVRVVATERIHTQGNSTKTENQKDVMINGGGFFQVLMPDGTAAYTRDGSFQTDQNGQLVTASGYPVQPAITLPPSATSLTVGRDGTVSVVQAGSTASVQIGQIQLATFLNATGLQAKGENLYVETDASGGANQTAPGQNGAGTLSQGYVESSNVNVVEELVNMIQTQRAYEINSKVVKTSDEMLARLSQL